MAARPGRVIQELEVDAPYPRGLAWRTSKEYGEMARRGSDALNGALHPAGGLEDA